MNTSIMMIAGEASGDLHGSHLARRLKELSPSVALFGIGGGLMKQAGVEVISDITDRAVIGFVEAIKNFLPLGKLLGDIKRLVKARKPDVVVLIDYSGFNLKVARSLSDLGVPLVYYFPPQIWASRSYRAKEIARIITKVIAVFPFEVDIYRRAGADFEFFGHPLLDVVATRLTRAEALKHFELENTSPVIGLLPGSRHHEIDRLLPLLLDSAEIISQTLPNAQFVLPVASSVNREEVTRLLQKSRLKVRIIENNTYDAIKVSNLVLVASGTATLEAAILGTPMVIVYRTSVLTWMLARFVVRVPFIGLANIVAGKEIVPEFLQNSARPELVAREALDILNNSDRLDKMKADLAEAVRTLGSPGAIECSARTILELNSRGRQGIEQGYRTADRQGALH